MTNNSKKSSNKIIKLFLVTTIVILSVIYLDIIYRKIGYNKFENSIIEFAEANKTTIFTIDSLFLQYNAEVIDNSINQDLTDLSISQYTDIGIYINNKSKESNLTNENTVKNLYIDNIDIQVKSEQGDKIFNYKNPLDLGKFRLLENNKNNRIDFNIIYTNDQNTNNNYDEPTFYTDCSNPISLGFINKDIVKNFVASESNENAVSFNGKVLKESGIKIEDIEACISFDIHIKNNLDQDFKTNIKLKTLIDEDDTAIYDGYIIKIYKQLEEGTFLKIPSKFWQGF